MEGADKFRKTYIAAWPWMGAAARPDGLRVCRCERERVDLGSGLCVRRGFSRAARRI